MHSPLLQKKALRKPAHQMHVVLVINDSGVLVYPAFFRTIILTVLSLRELLLMVNKSSNDVGFLNEDDGSMVPPGCHYAVIVKITVKRAFFSLPKTWSHTSLNGGRYLQHPLVPGAVLSTLCFPHLVFLRISLGRQCHFCFTGLPKRGLVTCLRQVANKWHKPISHRILAPKCMLFLV